MDQIAKDWSDILTATTAVAAFLVAAWSLLVSRDALRLAKAQDDRRRPRLTPYLDECYFVADRNAGGRDYWFKLTISNRSDADNAIADLSLHLTYETKAVVMVAKLPSQDAARPGGLSIPQKIDANDTISGWRHFRMDAGLLGDADLKGYALVLTDSHGGTAQLEIQLIREAPDA